MKASNNLRKIDSLILSEYIVKHYGPMSHLKLQKLLYYCDAYHLAYFGSELVTDEFEAWVHGPVSRKVFDSLRDKSMLYAELCYQYAPEDTDVDAEFDRLTSDQKSLITEVLNQLSKWSGLELEYNTHRERPWLRARAGYDAAEKCHEVISKEDMRTYYKEKLHGGKTD